VQPDFAQTVKQQADIVRVIGEYITLRKSGAQNYSALCPFHGEKTPSFSVHATRQFYHCFGCGQSGDVFAFVQKIENIGFLEAVAVVARKCGIPLPKREFSSPEEAREHRQRAKLLELQEAAAGWFQDQLGSPEAARAREYLTGRGVTAETIQKFRIGYAPDSFNALRDRLQGAAEQELLRQSGLFSSKEQADGSAGPLYARFRKRITFPIHNEAGKVIAFTARALDTNESSGPKYLNSPETQLFAKGQVLFNLDKARQPIRQLGYAVLVEGQMDCISAYMGGVQNVLATSGTAFTEMQVRLLSRYTKSVIVNFDPDAAGANAAEKSIALLTTEDFEVRVLTLEHGLDPDRFIRQRGVAAYVDAVKGAKPYTDYLIERALALFSPRTAENKSKALNYLLSHIRRVPDPFVRDEFATDAAQKLGIDSALVREEVKQAARKRREHIAASGLDTVSEAERLLLRAFSAAPESAIFQRATQALEAQPESFLDLRTAKLMGLLRERGVEDPIAAAGEPADRALLAQILLREQSELELKEVEAALETLRYRALTGRQRRLRAAIAEAERRANWDQVATLAVEKLKVDREVQQMGSENPN
jgi:DNA primase